MKRVRVIICMLMMMLGVIGLAPSTYADYPLDNTMELEFTPTKVWMSGKNLCMTGQFNNTRGDRIITKITQFNPNITFKRSDGTSYEFTKGPIKFPLCKLQPGERRSLTYNFGEFTDTWSSWVADPRYEYLCRDLI